MTQEQADQLKETAGLPEGLFEIQTFVSWPARTVLLFGVVSGRQIILVRELGKRAFQKITDLPVDARIAEVMCSDTYCTVVFTTAIQRKFNSLFLFDLRRSNPTPVTLSEWDGVSLASTRVWVQQLVSLDQERKLICLLGTLKGTSANYSLVELEVDSGAVTTIENWPAAIF